MIKISIIVPIYNVKKYMARCIESILKQKLQEFELILVDDGSTDGSGEVCDEYARRNNKIKVIHKVNGGLSSARNAGIDLAQGDYIGFVDGDDWIAEDMYENLYILCEENGLDIGVCGIELAYDDSTKNCVYYKNKSTLIMNKKEAFEKMFVETLYGVEAWNKLYKRKIFEDIRYPEGKLYEDTFVICQVLEQANKIGCVPSVGYHYYQRENSIMNTKKNMLSEDKIDSMDRVLMHLKQYYYETYLNSVGMLISGPLKDFDKVISDSSSDAKQFKYRIRKFVRAYIQDVKLHSNISIKMGILLYGICYCWYLTKLIYKFNKRNEYKRL